MTADTTVSQAARTCPHCAREPEHGWIETDNNGPIVPCPVCSPLNPETPHAS